MLTTDQIVQIAKENGAMVEKSDKGGICYTDKTGFHDITDMILPEMPFSEGTIRKTLIDENGMMHEVEETIELPYKKEKW